MIETANCKNIEVILNPSDEEVKANLQKSQAFILPSYYEGFGIAVLEAMSFGCIPIISNNTCGPDILSGTELERFLIPAGDVSALEKAIRELIKIDLAEKLFLSEIAVSISKNFTLSKYGERIVEKILL